MVKMVNEEVDGIIYVNRENLYRREIPYPINENLGEGNALDILHESIVQRRNKDNATRSIEIFKMLG